MSLVSDSAKGLREIFTAGTRIRLPPLVVAVTEALYLLVLGAVVVGLFALAMTT